jgi:AAA15 family ATPase/GTPase
MAVAFHQARKGGLLIDEIENGIHYSVMPRVWRSLAMLSKKFDVQLFATTHSNECIRAAHAAFKQERRYDFRLHRIDRIKKEPKVATFDNKMLSTAIESGLEIR